MLGIPVTVLTTAVGTALFSSLDSMSRTWQVAAGLVSMFAAVLAALQTFLNYPELAEKHRRAGSEFGELRRSVESVLAVPPSDADAMTQRLSELRESWRSVDEAAPPIPPRIYDRQRG